MMTFSDVAVILTTLPLYGKLKMQCNKSVPEIKPLRSKVSDVIAARMALVSWSTNCSDIVHFPLV